MAIQNGAIKDRLNVFYHEHPTLKGRNGNDKLKHRQIIIRYTTGGKERIEVLGWTFDKYCGEKVSENLAERKIKEFKTNARSGNGPISLAEEIELHRKADEADYEKAAQLKRLSLTFSDFFTETYLPQAKLDKKQQTCKTEESTYRLWIEPVVGELTFDKLSIDHLETIKANMLSGNRIDAKPHPRDRKDAAKGANQRRNPAKPLSARSISYAMAIIRQVWNRACASNPPLAQGDWPGASKSFKKPKIDNQRKRFLTKNESTILLAALKEKSQDLHDMALLSLHCGLRASEIFKLTWDKVDMSKGEILLAKTKNSESRIAYLTDQTKEMLRQRAINCLHQRIVFPTFIKGEAQHRKQISAAFSRTVTALGLNDGITDDNDKVVFHTLRHTYASWLVDNGASMPIVRDLMGHKNLIMTSRYSHVSAEAQREAVAALNRSMKPEGSNVIDIEKKRSERKD